MVYSVECICTRVLQNLCSLCKFNYVCMLGIGVKVVDMNVCMYGTLNVLSWWYFQL